MAKKSSNLLDNDKPLSGLFFYLSPIPQLWDCCPVQTIAHASWIDFSKIALSKMVDNPHFVQAALAQLPWWHHFLLLENVKKPKVQSLPAQISWYHNIIKTNFKTFGVHGLIPIVKILKKTIETNA